MLTSIVYIRPVVDRQLLKRSVKQHRSCRFVGKLKGQKAVVVSMIF